MSSQPFNPRLEIAPPLPIRIQSSTALFNRCVEHDKPIIVLCDLKSNYSDILQSFARTPLVEGFKGVASVQRIKLDQFNHEKICAEDVHPVAERALEGDRFAPEQVMRLGVLMAELIECLRGLASEATSQFYISRHRWDDIITMGRRAYTS